MPRGLGLKEKKNNNFLAKEGGERMEMDLN